MPLADRWKSRIRTAAAMASLCSARLAVAALPFNRWRGTLGGTQNSPTSNVEIDRARRFADHVNWAAKLLPFSTKCLPRAMALSWMLRAKDIDHCVVFAVRPAEKRGSDDQLHAWVEVAGETIIGELPGPWVETLRLGDGGRRGDPDWQ